MVNHINGNIEELLSLDMKGLAGNLPDNGILNLNGELSVPETLNLEPWLPFLDTLKISGSLFSENILLKKDGDITTLLTGINSDNFLLDFGGDNKLSAGNISTGKNGLSFKYKKENKSGK